MKQRWIKKGLIYGGDYGIPSQFHYAAWPTPFRINDEKIRVYFASRDENNFSSIFYLDLYLKNENFEIIEVSPFPILSPGSPGFFDDSGVTPCCICEIQGDLFLYYTGWSQQKAIPFQTFCGIAKLSNDMSYAEKLFAVPLLDRCIKEPLSVGSVFVNFFQETNRFSMWYESCLKWDVEKSKNDSFFSVNYASSLDGIKWSRNNFRAVKPQNGENIISRPSVIFAKNSFHMWYCKKYSGKYNIGYAESLDGIHWVRKDEEVGITTSDSGWDSEQICYPYVFEHLNIRYMLYNGNGYGKTGFGLAVLDEE